MNKIFLFVYCACCVSYSAYSQLPVAGILAGNPPHLCPGTCTNFVNTSTNATSYDWYFEGANPSTSTDSTPPYICYNMPGSYDVQLIATNSFGSDTLLLSNFVIVFPYPPPLAIEYCGDTLFATQGFASYQWYFSGTLINGATNYSYIQLQSGDYNVVAADANGCEVEAVIFNGWGTCNCCTRIDEITSGNAIDVYPNPSFSTISISNSTLLSFPYQVKIFNPIGEKVYDSYIRNSNSRMGLDVSALKPGIYILQISEEQNTFNTKFVKE